MTLPLTWSVPVTDTLRPVLRLLHAVGANTVVAVVVTDFEPTVNETAGHFPDNPDNVPLSCVVVGGGGSGGGGAAVGAP